MSETNDRNRTDDLSPNPSQRGVPEQVKCRRLTLALATTVLLAVLGGAVGISIYLRQAEQARSEEAVRAAAEQARQQRNAEAVAGLLDQTTEALQAGDAAKAELLLQVAQKRADEGGADALQERRARLQADLDVLKALDKIDQFRWAPVENHFPNAAEVVARFRAAMEPFGLNPASMPTEQAAARVSQSAVCARLVNALDWWLRQEHLPWVRQVLRAADPDAFRDAVRDTVLANDRAKLAELASQKEAQVQPPEFVAFLGDSGALSLERRRELLAVAVRQRPGDLGLLMALGGTHSNDNKEGVAERVRWYLAAAAVAPKNSAAHTNLGAALQAQGDWDAAIACYRTAIALDPRFALAHTNLGYALQAKDQVEEAIASYRKAIALDPKDANAHNNLGTALQAKGDFDAAIASYRKAIALDPRLAGAYINLGIALQGKGQFDEAIASLRKAIALDPRLARAHYHLGHALKAKGQLEAAIACYRTAITLDPKDAKAHNSLGNVLRAKGQLDEAIACHRKAIVLDPKFALAHGALGLDLLDKGRLGEARDAFRNALTLLPQKHQMLQWQEKLASAQESLEVAQSCQRKRLHFAAVRFAADAFAANPKLAENLQAAHRYHAACAAALAATGQGEDAGKLDEPEKARLRQQAREWLRADLTLFSQLCKSGPPTARTYVQKQLKHWQQDSNLAGLRDQDALAKLSVEERAATFTQLWAEVAALLKKAQKPPEKEGN